MTTKNKILIGVMFLVFGLMIYSEVNKKNLNWFPSYSTKHKIPFGTYIAHQEAKKIFNKNLIDVEVTPYLLLKKKKNIKGTYLIYNSSVSLGDLSINKLLTWVEKGNNLFISSSYFEKNLLDSLHVKIEQMYNSNFYNSIELKLVEKEFITNDSIKTNRVNNINTFLFEDNIDSKNYKVLGTLNNYSNLDDFLKDKENDSIQTITKANFIRVNYGKGKVYLHSSPYVFTNYFVLKDNNSEYLSAIFSYLNEQKPLYWDKNYQTGTSSKGILFYLLTSQAFNWAYRLLFVGLLLYVLFEGKRKQRAVPIITPLKNETVEFTKTIADIYLQNKEHLLIGQMHIKHFLDYVRNVLYINTMELNNEALEKIAQKSKTDNKIVKELFQLIAKFNNMEIASPAIVLKLEELIQKVKK